ncbi:MAG TPA: hypothetical protein VGB71_05280 [Flavisolibacter sp.]
MLRTIGLVLLAVSGSIMAAPVALPAAVVTIAGYAAVAGGVMSAVSQVTVEDKPTVGSQSGTTSSNRLGYDPDIYKE